MGDTVNIYAAKTQLSKLVARVEAGEEITLSRHGRPVALLVPLRMQVHDRQPGVWKGKVTVSEDFDAFTDPDAVEWFGE